MGIFILFTSSCKKDKDEDEDDTQVTAPATVNDVDGNVYHTVVIGTQAWLVENLHVTHYRNGDAIANVSDNTQWSNLTSGAYCCYNNSAPTATMYGYLYNWSAASDSRNIAPTGWHVATDADWTTLISYLGGESAAGGCLKETGTTHWVTPNTGASNSSGFTAIPGGDRLPTGGFDLITNYGCWWSTTASDASNAWGVNLYYGNANTVHGTYNKKCGMSIRCVMD